MADDANAVFVLRAWGEQQPTAEQVADELDRISTMLREGYTSGEAMVGEDFDGRGWWFTADLKEDQ